MSEIDEVLDELLSDLALLAGPNYDHICPARGLSRPQRNCSACVRDEVRDLHAHAKARLDRIRLGVPPAPAALAFPTEFATMVTALRIAAEKA